MNAASRGVLVAIEGIDGAGTTTQARLLAEHLEDNGIEVHQTFEPSAGPIGALIRKALSRQIDLTGDVLSLLFAADRVDHVRREMLPKTNNGVVVISDRYLFSSLAYQSVEQDGRWVALINALAPLPDLTFYIRVEPDLALERVAERGQDLEIFEERDLQVAIAAKYDELLGSAAEPALHLLDREDSGMRSVVEDLKGVAGAIRLGSPPDPGQDPGWSPLLSVVDGALPVENVQKTVREVYEEFASRRGIWDARR